MAKPKEPQETRAAPPYVAFRTFLNFIEWLEELIPQRIDRSFWGEKLSGAYGTQLMRAMTFFELIDGDKRPQPMLERLVKEKEHRPEIIGELLRKHYPTVVGLGLSNATASMFHDEFAKYPIERATLRKAEDFFVHAARFAGMPVSTMIAGRVRSIGGDTARTGSKATRKGARRGPTRRSTPPPPPDQLGEKARVSVVTGKPMISAALEQLPAENTWDQGHRDSWLTLFTNALDWDVKVTGKVK